MEFSQLSVKYPHEDAMNQPLISVLMPVHNGERFLAEAIQSILDQTYTHFELIIINDASTDRSLEIARAFENNDSRIHILSIKKSGVSAAVNAALDIVQGQFIARMDADDIALPNRFMRQVEFMTEHPDIAACGTYAERMGSKGRVAGISETGPTSYEEFERQRDNVSIFFCNPTTIYRTTVFLQMGGYDSELDVAGDFHLWNRIAMHHPMLTLPEIHLRYRIHDSALGTSRMRKQALRSEQIKVNLRRDRHGLSSLTPQEFDELWKSYGWRHNIRWERRFRSQYAYRKAGAKIADGHPSGYLWLMLGGLLAPGLVVSKLRHQRVSSIMVRRGRKKLVGVSM